MAKHNTLSMFTILIVLAAGAYGGDELTALRRDVEQLKIEVAQLKALLQNNTANSGKLRMEDYRGTTVDSNRGPANLAPGLGTESISPAQMQELSKQLNQLKLKKDEHDKFLQDLEKNL